MGFEELVAAAQVEDVARRWAAVAAQVALVRQASTLVEASDPLHCGPDWEPGRAIRAQELGAPVRGW